MKLTIKQALQNGIAAHKKGKIEEAERLYRAILQSQPTHPDANHNLGIIAVSVGKDEAALSFFKIALDANPKIEQFWLSYIKALIEEKQLDAAKAVLENAKKKGMNGEKFHALVSQLRPIKKLQNYNHLSPPKAQLSLLLKYYQSGQLNAAEILAISTTQEFPSHQFGWKLLGAILAQTGRIKESLVANQKSVQLEPQDFEAHNNLGITLQELVRLEDSELSFRKALALKSDLPEVHNNLGNTLKELGRLDEAEAYYKQAIELKYDFTEAHINLGITLNAMGLMEGALKHFEINLQLERGESRLNMEHKSFTTISNSKLDHDIEQFKYLAKSGYDIKKFQELAKLYKKIKSEINNTSDTEVFLLSDRHKDLLEDSYNRPSLILKAPALIKTPISASFNEHKITEDYFKHEFGLTYFDDFLSPVALESLRDFLLGSTIWFDFFHDNGYVGSYLMEGLASPLILQISEDLRKRLPKIFKNNHLTNLWAYKYDSRAYDKKKSFGGINVHADFAAINVNFWITPQSANLDPSSGGLVVYNAEAPLEWSFKKYNNNDKEIRKEILKSDQKKTIIPYSENRAVIFNSNLFHETDDINFKEGYENRRINITMLFGRREL
tara:strand:+ start:197 stop:2032 length:1836 start_codon:yes stop_codon:yes gene_type:complete